MSREDEETATLRGEEIVCVGFAEWNPELPTNQHHLMSRLSQTNRVLFIESLGLRRPQVSRRDLRRLGRRLRDGLRGSRREGDVHVVSPLALPAHGNRLFRVVNRFLLRRQVSNAVTRLGFHRPILWAYAPHAEALIDTLDPSLIVYHCVDDLAAQRGVHAESFRSAERRFASRADIVLASAPSLVERLQQISQRVVAAPNVADVSYFATAMEPGPVDEALARLPPPRIVFTGAIVETKVDMDWLVSLAHLCPHWSFALVGPVGLGDSRTDVSPLRALANIYFLGSRPYNALPSVLRGADAAIIPYALNALTASVFPMKVYEYLAAGLPVVATPLPALHGVPQVALAHDAPAAAAHLVRLISENTSERRQARLASAIGHSWSDRLAEIATAAESVRPTVGARWSSGDLVVDLDDC